MFIDAFKLFQNIISVPKHKRTVFEIFSYSFIYKIIFNFLTELINLPLIMLHIFL